MADIELVIKVPEKLYNMACNYPEMVLAGYPQCIRNGTPLPQGHGGLVDYEELKNNAREYGAYAEAILSHIKSKTIIDADRKCKVEIINRGNCMICGKELDEGLFFCKECEAKSESEETDADIKSCKKVDGK